MAKIEPPNINPFGFREYDARWLYPKDINLKGIKTTSSVKNLIEGAGGKIEV